MTPEDSATLLAIVKSELANVSTTIPAVVLKHDTNAQTVDVELAVKRPYFGSNNSPEDQPIRLIKVPLIFPQGSDWVIAGQLVKGDAVLIHCSMFDCEPWIIGDKNRVYEAGSKYYHDINSAFATPGAFTYKTPTRDPRFKGKFHIKQGNNYITMENGKMVIESSGGSSRITLQDGTVTIDATHVQVNAPTSKFDGDLTVTGKINAPNIVADTNLEVASIKMQTHRHAPSTVPPSN